jgi:hypothetical protein
MRLINRRKANLFRNATPEAAGKKNCKNVFHRTGQFAAGRRSSRLYSNPRPTKSRMRDIARLARYCLARFDYKVKTDAIVIKDRFARTRSDLSISGGGERHPFLGPPLPPAVA